MTAPLRVTAVCGAGVLGGAELWLTALLGATDRIDADAVVLAEGPLVAELTANCGSVVVNPTGPGPVTIARAAMRLTRRLRADQPDLVLANGIKAATVVAPAALLAGVRFVWCKHDHSFDGRLLTKVMARLADGVVAGSPSLARAAGVVNPIVVVSPRSDRPLQPRDLARATLAGAGLRPGPGRLVFAVVGRIVRYKGIEDAVCALALPGADRWQLAVIGDADPSEPAEQARLERLAGTIGVADRITFTGPLAGASGLLTGVDAVGILTKDVGRGPSREGFAMVATEAMLAGVPVVTTTAGPVFERLAGRAGLGIPSGDPAALAAALGTLTDPAIRAAMGAAGTEPLRVAPGRRGRCRDARP